MFKFIKNILLFIIYFFLSGNLIFAEDITVTTYYPSPHGQYNQLQTNKLAVGDVDTTGTLDAADQPTANGQASVARSVIFKPLSVDPDTNQREGELIYHQDSNYDKWKFYNGTRWQNLQNYEFDVVNIVTDYYSKWVGAQCVGGELNLLHTACKGGIGTFIAAHNEWPRPACPTTSGWGAAIYTTIWRGAQENWYTTCLVEKKCRVMYLRATQDYGSLPNCPTGWLSIPGSPFKEKASSSDYNMTQVCVLAECAS